MGITWWAGPAALAGDRGQGQRLETEARVSPKTSPASSFLPWKPESGASRNCSVKSWPVFSPSDPFLRLRSTTEPEWARPLTVESLLWTRPSGKVQPLLLAGRGHPAGVPALPEPVLIGFCSPWWAASQIDVAVSSKFTLSSGWSPQSPTCRWRQKACYPRSCSRSRCLGWSTCLTPLWLPGPHSCRRVPEVETSRAAPCCTAEEPAAGRPLPRGLQKHRPPLCRMPMPDHCPDQQRLLGTAITSPSHSARTLCTWSAARWWTPWHVWEGCWLWVAKRWGSLADPCPRGQRCASAVDPHQDPNLNMLLLLIHKNQMMAFIRAREKGGGDYSFRPYNPYLWRIKFTKCKMVKISFLPCECQSTTARACPLSRWGRGCPLSA